MRARRYRTVHRGPTLAMAFRLVAGPCLVRSIPGTVVHCRRRNHRHLLSNAASAGIESLLYGRPFRSDDDCKGLIAASTKRYSLRRPQTVHLQVAAKE